MSASSASFSSTTCSSSSSICDNRGVIDVSNVLFTKNEIEIYEKIFARLLDPSGPKDRIASNAVTALLSTAAAAEARPIFANIQQRIRRSDDTMTTQRFNGFYERKDFYLILRLASIAYVKQSINQASLVTRFEPSDSFIALIEDAAQRVSAECIQSAMTLSIPPPPQSGKTKLKRVHTIPGATTIVTSFATLSSPSPSPPSFSLAKTATAAAAAASTAITAAPITGSLSSLSSSSSISSSSCNFHPPNYNNQNHHKNQSSKSNDEINSILFDGETKNRKLAGESSNNNQNDEDDQDHDHDILDVWRITAEQRAYYSKQFYALISAAATAAHQQPQPNQHHVRLHNRVFGYSAKSFFERSGLPIPELSHIWKLSDVDKDGALSLREFCVAMHLVVLRRNGVRMPTIIPRRLFRLYFDNRNDVTNSDDDANADDDDDDDIDANGESDTHKNDHYHYHNDKKLSEEPKEPPPPPPQPTQAQDSSSQSSILLPPSSASSITKNWTQFDDTSILSNNNNNNNSGNNSTHEFNLIVEKQPKISATVSTAATARREQPPLSSVRNQSSSSSSYLYPLKFDYNPQTIATDPEIRHPVPLRIVSPTSSVDDDDNQDDEDGRYDGGNYSNANLEHIFDPDPQSFAAGTTFTMINGTNIGSTSLSSSSSTTPPPFSLLVPSSSSLSAIEARTLLRDPSLEQRLEARYRSPPPPPPPTQLLNLVGNNSSSSSSPPVPLSGSSTIFASNQLDSSLGADQRIRVYAHDLHRTNRSLLREMFALIELARKATAHPAHTDTG